MMLLAQVFDGARLADRDFAGNKERVAREGAAAGARERKRHTRIGNKDVVANGEP